MVPGSVVSIDVVCIVYVRYYSLFLIIAGIESRRTISAIGTGLDEMDRK